jgi:hypothetical protein
MFEKHGMVNHGIGEYVRGEVSTNSIEGYFSILKRGITGTYHHVSQERLKRHLPSSISGTTSAPGLK